MRTLFLGNDWEIHRTNVTSRGVPQHELTVRGFLSATVDGAAIHASLALAQLEELAPGDYIGTLQGDDLTDHLGPLWAAAQAAGTTLIIYERVIVDDEDYSDYEALVVERDRPAGR